MEALAGVGVSRAAVVRSERADTSFRPRATTNKAAAKRETQRAERAIQHRLVEKIADHAVGKQSSLSRQDQHVVLDHCESPGEKIRKTFPLTHGE
jgi:hypothetical protein